MMYNDIYSSQKLIEFLLIKILKSVNLFKNMEAVLQLNKLFIISDWVLILTFGLAVQPVLDILLISRRAATSLENYIYWN